MGTVDDQGYVIPPRLWAWAGTRRAVRVFLWLFALSVGMHHLLHAREWYADGPDTPAPLRRPDPGGHGHTQIDFGGQWVMGRMLVRGHGREMYHRQQQWEVVREGYPQSAETPVQRDETILPKDRRQSARTDDDVGHDADRLMSWFMGADPPEPWKKVGGATVAPLAAGPFAGPFAAAAFTRAAAETVTPAVVAEVNAPAVGGPLYPPVHAFFYAPLGLLDHPHDAYALFQVIATGLAYVAGLGICVLTRGRVWWSVASAGVLLYPGCRSGLDLGQNPTLSLCLALWGWVLVTRGRGVAGGVVWGLFAFKPVWGMAFFLVPLLAGRWRVCLAMVGTGAALGVLTLPAVGVQTWFDWLVVGKEAAAVYNDSQNWVRLSRDLQGIPRRFLLDFTRPEGQRDTPLAQAVAWGLWAVVFGTTALVYRFRADRRQTTGLGAGFLFLGAFLTCYRFMYYDVLLSLVGMACLFAEPARFFRTRVFGLTLVPQTPGPGHQLDLPTAPTAPFGPKLIGYVNSFPLTVLAGLYLLENVLTTLGVEATIGVIGWGAPVTRPDGSTAVTAPRVGADTSIGYPWDTVLVITLWAWCGLRLVLGAERPGRGDGVTPGAPAGG